MFRLFFIILILTIISTTINLYASDEEVREIIRQRVEQARQFEDIYLQDETISGIRILPDFYEGLNFMPAWQNMIKIDELIQVIEEMKQEGLNPSDYHYEGILELKERINNAEIAEAYDIADIDIAASDALIRIAYHLLFGKVDPERLDANWNIYKDISHVEPVEWLNTVIESPSIYNYFKAVKSRYPFFNAMRKALAHYRLLEELGGWASIPSGNTLKPGMDDDRIPMIRKRLSLTNDIPQSANLDDRVYDEILQTGVKLFQERHGLNPDGAIGKNTLAEMNVPVRKRIEQILVNFERGRWVYRDIDDKLIFVNIASFVTDFVENRKVTWSARAQVGKNYRKTPVFKSSLQYIVFNPTWTVPPTILKKDVLPAIKKDFSYLKRKNMKVINRKGKIVDPLSIDWKNVKAENFPYSIRQDPGPNNALGRVKFIFPNEHFVFIHDTPSKILFAKEIRTFSSGCIRVENPLKLAELLLDDEEKWNMENIMDVINSKKTRTVHLEEPLPVLIMYATAFPNFNDDVINFRMDIYNRDAAVLKGLQDTFKRKKRHLGN